MNATVPEQFEREQSLSEANWLRSLPGAVGPHALARPAPTQAVVAIDTGHLWLSWTLLPPRRLGLLQLPRMNIAYRFEGVDVQTRQDFMCFFDLHTVRGGG